LTKPIRQTPTPHASFLLEVAVRRKTQAGKGKCPIDDIPVKSTYGYSCSRSTITIVGIEGEEA
jgi:hypothetical protein